MTKEEFLTKLKVIYESYSESRVDDNIGGEYLEKVKKLAFSYDSELFYHLFDKWVNDEQAADIIRRQHTLSDIMGAVYYIDHLVGLYRYSIDKDDGSAELMDSDLYDVIEDIFEALDEPDPKWYMGD